MRGNLRYLGWDKPLLDTAAEYLLAAAASSSHPWLDLTNTVVVVQTAQAGRRLRERLAALAHARGCGLLAPRVVLPAHLLRLGAHTGVVACPAEAVAVMAAAIRSLCEDDQLPHLFPSASAHAAQDNPRFFLDAAHRLCDLRATLAENGLDCRAAAAMLAKNLTTDLPWQPERWDDLVRLDDAYGTLLAKAHLVDAGALDRAAAESPSLPSHIDRIVFMAVPDPMPLALQFADRLPDRIAVEVCVYAPADLAGSFDAWGRPLYAAWSVCRVPLADNEIALVGTPDDQARDAAEWAAAVVAEDVPASAQVACGAVDPEIVPQLVRACVQRGITVADPSGRPLAAHNLFTLVNLLASLAQSDQYADFSALLRHPQFCHHILNETDATAWRALLTQADTFQNDALPCGFGDAVARLGQKKPSAKFPLLAAAAARVADQVALLRAPQGTPEQALLAMLGAVFAARMLVRANAEDAAFESAAGSLRAAIEDTTKAAAAAGITDPAERLDLLLDVAGRLRYPVKPDDTALDAEGWLELVWNDAPHLLLAGFNEGRVPSCIAGDPFLPNVARTALGLPDNDARFARDAYVLFALLAWRRAAGACVRVLVGKKNATGDVLRPSRLLFLCADEALPARAAALFGKIVPTRPVAVRSRAFSLVPRRVPPPTHMSPTAFGAYLKCPFRFYLRRVLGMSALDDRVLEMDALVFGSLCHDVLKMFADNAAVRDSTDAAEIASFLGSALDHAASARFCANQPATVTYQIESLRQRLRAFAEVQACHRAQGWRIERTEFDFDDSFSLAGMPLRGRIDRIDINDRTGERLILDYKTSDTGKAPAEMHLTSPGTLPTLPAWSFLPDGKKRWNDLQLPIYLLYARHAGMDAARVAYLNLPKATATTAIVFWDDLDKHTLDSARHCAEGIVDRVRNGIFWPPQDKVGPFEDEELRAIFMADSVSAAVEPWPEWRAVSAPPAAASDDEEGQ